MSLDNDTHFEERDTENYKIKNVIIKQGYSQLIHSSITNLQPTDSHLVHPNTLSPKQADNDLMPTVLHHKNVVSPVAADALNSNNSVHKNFQSDAESAKTNNIFSFSLHVLLRSKRNRRAPARLQSGKAVMLRVCL